MKYLRLVCLTFTSFTCTLLHGQVDSAYIGSFQRDFSIQTYVYQKSTSLAYEVGDVETNYRPNSPVGIGLGINYKNFSLSGGRTFSAFRDKDKGKTELLDFQYHYYGRKFIADVFFQNYKGFYVMEGEKEKAVRLHPDIKLAQYGLAGQYVFNNKRYSYRAAFHQREKQIRSTGSFHVGAGAYYNYLSGDESIVVDHDNQLSNYQVGISGGYAHTFVIKKDFFVALDVSVGVNLGAEKLRNLLKSPDITPTFFPRASVGYNSETWSISVNGVMNRVYVSHTKAANIMFDTERMNVNFTKRFKTSPKILQRIKFLNK